MENTVEKQAQELLSDAKIMKNNCKDLQQYKRFSLKDFIILGFVQAAPITGWTDEVLERAKELSKNEPL